MKDEKFIIICYDIKSDKRRTKLSNILEDYGMRVQYSVFECFLTNKLIENLKSRIAELIDEEEDKVYYYHLCDRCVSNIEILGEKEAGVLEKVDCYIV